MINIKKNDKYKIKIRIWLKKKIILKEKSNFKFIRMNRPVIFYNINLYKEMLCFISFSFLK